MKKLLYIIGFVALISCTENTYILDNLEDVEAENPFKDCFNVVSIATGSAECPDILTLKVVTNDFFNMGVQSTPNDRTLICVTNNSYVFNDFTLGQILCDLSIYN